GAGAVGPGCASAGEGIGGVAEDHARELGAFGVGDCTKLEDVRVHRDPHDGDEPGCTWHAGHVSDVFETAVAVRGWARGGNIGGVRGGGGHPGGTLGGGGGARGAGGPGGRGASCGGRGSGPPL